MAPPAVSRALTRIAPALEPYLPGLVERTVDGITGTIGFYRDTDLVSRDEIRTMVRDNIEFAFRTEVDGDESAASPPRTAGRIHAERSAPLADLLAAYRLGFALLWETISGELLAAGVLEPAEVIDAATALFWHSARFGQATTEAHRDTTTEVLLRQEHERSAMVEAVITGTTTERAALWETAGRLGIPHSGHFVVAVADADPFGGDPLPGVTARLRAAGIVSAWRLAPHQAVGVVALRDADPSAAMTCLHAHATGPVGVSPVFTHLEEAPRAFYLAGVALHSRPNPESRVRRFDDTPIAALVAAAPDAARAIAQNVLGPVLRLPVHDRDTLLETLEAWLRSGGSITEAAAKVYCHPNTVRYRLRKLADYTGRATEDPHATSELDAALQAWRLVGTDTDDATA